MLLCVYRKLNENSTITATTTAITPVMSTIATPASDETVYYRVRANFTGYKMAKLMFIIRNVIELGTQAKRIIVRNRKNKTNKS